MNNCIKIIADWLFWCYYYTTTALKLMCGEKVKTDIKSYKVKTLGINQEDGISFGICLRNVQKNTETMQALFPRKNHSFLFITSIICKIGGKNKLYLRYSLPCHFIILYHLPAHDLKIPIAFRTLAAGGVTWK